MRAVHGDERPVKTPPPAPKQVTLAASFSRGVPYSKTDAKWKRITDAVAFHIAKDMVPINTIENAGFRHLLEVMDPRYPPAILKNDKPLHFIHSSLFKMIEKQYLSVALNSQ